MKSKHLYAFSYWRMTRAMSMLDNHSLGFFFQVDGAFGTKESFQSCGMSRPNHFVCRNQHRSWPHTLPMCCCKERWMVRGSSLSMRTSGCRAFHRSRNPRNVSSEKHVKGNPSCSVAGLHLAAGASAAAAAASPATASETTLLLVASLTVRSFRPLLPPPLFRAEYRCDTRPCPCPCPCPRPRFRCRHRCVTWPCLFRGSDDARTVCRVRRCRLVCMDQKQIENARKETWVVCVRPFRAA